MGDDCWLWTASCSGGRHNEYGQFWVGKRSEGHRRRWYAHRLAYELWVGRIPEGLEVLHHCDVKRCCRPEHLFVGTQQDNMEDWWAKGLSPQGERSVTAKLTAEQALEVRSLCDEGQNHGEIALKFGISREQVSRIGRRVRWRHLEEAA